MSTDTSTPPLVDVIAAALWNSRPAVVGKIRPGWESVTQHPGMYAHDVERTHDQARAVLAAISESGEVEWGVRWDHISEMYPERTDWGQSREVAQATIDNSFASGSVVTRLAAGPWTAE